MDSWHRMELHLVNSAETKHKQTIDKDVVLHNTYVTFCGATKSGRVNFFTWDMVGAPGCWSLMTCHTNLRLTSPYHMLQEGISNCTPPHNQRSTAQRQVDGGCWVAGTEEQQLRRELMAKSQCWWCQPPSSAPSLRRCQVKGYQLSIHSRCLIHSLHPSSSSIASHSSCS